MVFHADRLSGHWLLCFSGSHAVGCAGFYVSLSPLFTCCGLGFRFGTQFRKTIQNNDTKICQTLMQVVDL
jgi:hypothetical protein